MDVRDGELGLTHDLPTYKSMDRLRGLRLAYNSRSAAPSALVGMDYDFQEDPEEWEPLGHTVEVRVGGRAERFSFAKADGPCRFSYLWQPEAEGDAAVPTGSYTYQMDLSNDYTVNYWTSLNLPEPSSRKPMCRATACPPDGILHSRTRCHPQSCRKALSGQGGV